jgi:hypothetical protein
MCIASFDNAAHPAEVLDAKPSENRYYVHYLEMDKRMDEWVTGDKLSAFTGATPRGPAEATSALPAVGTELVSPSGDAQKVTRRLKRKLEEYHHVVAGQSLSECLSTTRIKT